MKLVSGSEPKHILSSLRLLPHNPLFSPCSVLWTYWVGIGFSLKSMPEFVTV